MKLCYSSQLSFCGNRSHIDCLEHKFGKPMLPAHDKRYDYRDAIFQEILLCTKKKEKHILSENSEAFQEVLIILYHISVTFSVTNILIICQLPGMPFYHGQHVLTKDHTYLPGGSLAGKSLNFRPACPSCSS